MPSPLCNMSAGAHHTSIAELSTGRTLHLLKWNPDLKPPQHSSACLSQHGIPSRSNAEFERENFIHPSQIWNLRAETKIMAQSDLSFTYGSLKNNPLVPYAQQNNIEDPLWGQGLLVTETPEEGANLKTESKACTNSWNCEELPDLNLMSEVQLDAFEAERQQEGSYWEMLSLEKTVDMFCRTDEIPSIESCICILLKCRKNKSSQFGKHVHAHMCKNGLESHEALGNHGVPMLVECGSLPAAQQLFNRLVHVNEHAWTSLILGHIQFGQVQHAFYLYQKMQEDGMHPSSHTLVALLKACARLNAVDLGRHLHIEIAQKGFERDLFVCNTLIVMYAKCGLLSEAQGVFDKLPVRGVVSWNVLIAAYIENGSCEEALKCFKAMEWEGVSPDAFTFACILKACSSIGAIDKGRELHLKIAEGGFKSDSFVGNGLVGLYAKCGSLSEAREVFDKLPNQDVVSWTALIAGYTEHGPGQEALRCFEQMQVEGVSPDLITFASVLKACGSIGASEKGRGLHKELLLKGLESKSSLGNSLVGMYAKFGSLSEAQEVFDMLPVQDVVSWNALITGYVEHGLGQEALTCFEQMHLHGVSPDSVTHACSLKACSSIGAVVQGQGIHRQAAFQGLEEDLLFGNTLVGFYAKFGLFLEAQQTFDKLPHQDVVSWNALIAGYCEHGPGQEALKCFEQMQMEGICPDVASFACILKACSNMDSIDKGHDLRLEVAHRGLDKDLLVGNALISMYSKFGLLQEAQEIFDELPVRDVVSWNALISGYSEHGPVQEALKCFEKMQTKGSSLDAVTYACIMKACGIIQALDTCRETHMEITQKGFRGDLVDNALVGMYAKCGLFADAQYVFKKLPVQDVVSWTSLIAGYAEHGRFEEALENFEHMQLQGIFQNAITYACVLKACVGLKLIDKGREIHTEIVQKGFEGDVGAANTLVGMYAKCGSFAEAWEVFDELLVQDDVSWTALIAGYTEHGPCKEALTCFECMQLKGISPNVVTFACILKACGSIGAINKGQELHREIKQKGFDRDPLVVNSLIGMYSKCGLLSEAQEAFNMLPIRDVTAWSSMIQGYGMNHEGGMAVQCFEDMQEQGVKPDAVTFTCLLSSCSHTSLISKGQEYFKLMREGYGLVPTKDHYTCLVDLLARSGHLYEAEKCTEMLCPSSEGSWIALLSACKTCGEIDLGLRCFQQLVKLNPEVAAWYVLMADIYAGAGRWENVFKMEELRKHAGALKKPASALIEVNKKVHEFVVGNNQDNEITSMLEVLNVRLKEGGHVPNLNQVLWPVCDEDKEVVLCEHAEKMAIAFGLLNTPQGETLRITKNLRMCNDCHDASKVVSKIERRDIILRDNCCIHHFKDGLCSCGDTF